MQDVRCMQCQKLLARAVYSALDIKCPRCNTMNSLRVQNPIPERQRVPNQEIINGKAHSSVDRW
ncbi:MAG: Com family DNA-binding transcriptional regulator [Nitrincola lacisaponensis]|uniref:Com family DNA-binding transcriptional regulator n=1 Tax=Nitrincola lacisaponensis TaxID=267850 RepID=UPI00391D2561